MGSTAIYRTSEYYEGAQIEEDTPSGTSSGRGDTKMLTHFGQNTRKLGRYRRSRPQTYALDRAATGISNLNITMMNFVLPIITVITILITTGY
jgi:hypothetical protein